MNFTGGKRNQLKRKHGNVLRYGNLSDDEHDECEQPVSGILRKVKDRVQNKANYDLMALKGF